MSFFAHAQAHGLILEHVIPDGRWHRVRTEDKPRKRNGAYVFDGVAGAVKNWATMEGFAAYREGRENHIDRRQLQAVRHAAQINEQQRREAAKREAARIVREARIVTPRLAARKLEPIAGHPYLVAKGFPLQPFMECDGKLIVPMRTVRGDLVSVQTIDANGLKLFLAGGQAKGAIHRLGGKKPSPVWLCEGYATGLSMKAALKDMYSDAPVIVCFSASNLRYIASLGLGTHVMADNDASGTGQGAAVATGLPWVMPEAVGMDANDWERARGLRALCKLMRDV